MPGIVDTAKTNGVDTINNIQPTVVKKQAATEKMQLELKAEIDQTPNATDENAKLKLMKQ